MLPFFMWVMMMGDEKIYGGYYIKAKRIQESDIAHASPIVREVWDWLLRKANYKETRYSGHIVKRGQLFCTIKDIKDDLHWKVGYRKMSYNENVTKTSLKWLRRHLMITSLKTPRGILITICNYDYYQNPQNYENPNEDANENPIKTPVRPQCDATITKECGHEQVSESYCSMVHDSSSLCHHRPHSNRLHLSHNVYIFSHVLQQEPEHFYDY